jgi:peptidyl-prolyl cis-trans isomerase D
MFDLFRSRDKAVRILLGALLLLVALSMLTYLIPSYNTGNGPSDTVLAEVDGDPVTTLELQRVVNNAVRGKQLPPDIVPTFVPQMLDQIVTERALAYQAAKLGYQVTDAEMAEAIRQYVPALFPDGKFVGKDLYASYLGQQNLSIQEFEDTMRRQLLITRLRNIAVEGTIVTPAEIESEYRKRNEKVKIEYVKLTSDKYKAEVQPTADEMQNYYNINKARYMTPETRNLVILIGDGSKLEQSLTISDADLQKLYQQNLNTYRIPETVKVRHILLKTIGKPESDEPKVKAQADDILKQVKAGADFGALVKKYSEDTASVAQNGEYDVQRNGQMVPEFETAAFTLKPGQTDIVKTKYGYHILQVVKHDEPRLKPFEEVKGELASQWKKQRAADMVQQMSDRAQTMLQKDPTHPEKVAEELHMQLVQANGVEAGKPIPEVGTNADFEQALAGLKKGDVSQPVALANNKVALAVVTDVVAPHPQTYQEVQSQIRDAIVQNRAVVAVQKHALELVTKAQAMGGDLEKAAKSMGLEAKTTDEFTRAGAAEGLGPASYVAEAFTKPAGSVFGPVTTPDATVVVKVISHAPADMSKLPEQRASIRDELKSQKARERGSLFEAGLREALVKAGKIKYHKDVVDRVLASYARS